MFSFIRKSVFLLAVLTLFSINGLYAQKLPKCVKVAKTHRPNWLSVKKSDLEKFYKNYGEEVTFVNLKVVKSELSYYLLASEQDGPRIFAFELEQKGKRLFLNKLYSVQTCDQGDLSLDTFLQKEGKIQACRNGKHTVKEGENEGMRE